MKIRIATRKSALALWQAEHVAMLLRQLDGVRGVELVPLSTRGDEILDRSLQKIGGKGLFIKELEVAMQEGAADIAVHSMKDVPADMPAGFTIAAVLERANHADALVSPNGEQLADLQHGAIIGSSSLRRQAQLKMLRPDVDVQPLRGNVNTRLAKLDDGAFDAIVLAAAGLERLELAARISQQFSPQDMLPAATQGVIGIECCTDNAALVDLLQKLNHAATIVTTAAERAIAKTLQANCQSPVAAYASRDDSMLKLAALVALPDGSEFIRDALSIAIPSIEVRSTDMQLGDESPAATLGHELAERLLSAGARDVLSRSETMNG